MIEYSFNICFDQELNLEPCRFFHLQKTCEQGELCPYSHDPLTPESLERLRKLTGPCRFWQFKGYCVTGDACLFAHDEISEEERKKLESTITPCIYYHLKGGCRSGDDCFYLHNEATAEQVNQLKNELNNNSEKKMEIVNNLQQKVAQKTVCIKNRINHS